MSASLSPTQRSIVLDAAFDAVSRASPGAFSQGQRDRPGGADEIDKHLDALVAIVRRTTATRIEPFMTQILDDVCSKCPWQASGTHCGLRSARQCLLYRNVGIVVGAIAEALREIGDGEYWELHSPSMLGFLRNPN